MGGGRLQREFKRKAERKMWINPTRKKFGARDSKGASVRSLPGDPLHPQVARTQQQ